jgi:Regulator of chromosome condensation (RCC1) repeat
MSQSWKKRKANFEDGLANGTPNSSSTASVGSRKTLKTANKVSNRTENSSFVRLKESLYQMGNTEVMEHFEPLFTTSNKRLPKGEDLQPDQSPHFVQASIVDMRWKLAEQRDLYGRPTGDVIGFGMEDMGQLGLIYLVDKEKDDGYPPTLLTEMIGTGVIQVAAGAIHSVGLVESGTAYSWGCGDEGQLGRLFESDLDQVKATAITKMHPSKHAVSSHKVRSPENESSDVIAVAAGDSTSVFQTISGNVYVAGM